MTPGSGREVNTTLPLVLSIASTLLCCNPVFGLPAIVMAIRAKNARDMGNLDGAAKQARTSLLLGALGMGLGLLFEVYELFAFLAA
jgi:hypothetical protein